MTAFSIGTRQIGDGAPCFIVAEVGLAHDGSLGNAHAFIDAVAESGADCVKFQAHMAEYESTPDEPWRVKPEWPQDANRYGFWKRTSFTQEQWWGLSQHARLKGLEFLCSPFSVIAVRMMDRMVKAWKVPSGEITNHKLLEAIRRTGKPVILSSGMSPIQEVLEAEREVAPCPTRSLMCTSAYPCPTDRIGLSTMDAWDGLSDHSGSIYPGLGAVALGAAILEVHVCWSKEQFGFDTSSSITIQELGELVKGARIIHEALKPVDKDAMAKELEPMRELFMNRAKWARQLGRTAESHVSAGSDACECAEYPVAHYHA